MHLFPSPPGAQNVKTIKYRFRLKKGVKNAENFENKFLLKISDFSPILNFLLDSPIVSRPLRRPPSLLLVMTCVWN